MYTEQDLTSIQQCSRLHSLRKEIPVTHKQVSFFAIQRKVVVYMLAQYLIREAYPTKDRLKEKIFEFCTTAWSDPLQTKPHSLKNVGLLVASVYPRAEELYEWLVGSELTPAATALPVKLELENGSIEVVLDGLVIQDGETKLLNLSNDRFNKHTTTNLAYLARLTAANQLLDVKECLNVHVYPGVPIHTFHFKPKYRKTLVDAVSLIKANTNVPLLNCRYNCPYKSICQ